MSKQDILNKFEAAAQCGNSPQAIAYLNELRRDYLDMYFVKEEFTQELIKMFSKKWDKKCSQLWGDVYTHFSALIVPHDLLTGMLRNIRFYNFWIYESFVHAGAMYPTDNFELFYRAIEGGSWEIIQRSLPCIQAEKYPELFFLALRNDDIRVRENLYGLFEPNTIEKIYTDLMEQDRVILSPEPLPHSQVTGFLLRPSDKKVLNDFMFHQQKIRLLSHIKQDSITHTRKI